MILADTSIWIEFLKKSRKYFFQVKDLIESNQIIAHESIFAELLQGARNESERKVILDYWNNIAKVSIEDIWIEAGVLSSQEKLYNKGIGIIDTVIMLCAKYSKAKIWTLDIKLSSILKEKEKYYFNTD